MANLPDKHPVVEFVKTSIPLDFENESQFLCPDLKRNVNLQRNQPESNFSLEGLTVDMNCNY